MIKSVLKEEIKKILKIDKDFTITDPPENIDADFSTNLLFVLSNEIEKIYKEISPCLAKIEMIDNFYVSAPGFLNIKIKKEYFQNELLKVLNEKENYPSLKIGKNKKISIEYVSANPTGPLHIGHARSAFIGEAIAKIYEKLNYKVDRYYYINDVGYQVYLLTQTVKLKIKQKITNLSQDEINFINEKGYKGKYIEDLVNLLKEKFKIHNLQKLEKISFQRMSDYLVREILNWIKRDFKVLNIKFDFWISEKSFYIPKNLVEKKINEIKNYIYEKNGAIFFKSSLFDDDKDRVLKRSKRIDVQDTSYGGFTYFASDIFYHWMRYKKNYEKLINVWGADHHGYIPRLTSALKALGCDVQKLKIVLYQFVSLIENGTKISMSTREGRYITLNELINKIGVDAAKFFLLSSSPDSHIEINVNLAKQKSLENPLYYIQYAHTRCCGIFRKMREKLLKFTKKINISLLSEKQEINLLKKISSYGDVLLTSHYILSPHILINYLYELSNTFHKYYETFPIISENRELTNSRLALVKGVQTIIKNGLGILGISAPEVM